MQFVSFRSKSCSLGLRAGNGLSNALNEFATKPSPAAEIESRRCNPMMQNPAFCVQDPKSASRLFQLQVSTTCPTKGHKGITTGHMTEKDNLPFCDNIGMMH
jgi:hypothetical protein